MLLTLRADFLGQALTYRPLADALQGADLKLGPMTRAELTEAVEKPAARQGVRFEATLVERILDDVGQTEGGLPLLEFALTELWQQQQQRQLSHVAYEAIGEITGALSRHADRAYTGLSADQQAQARRIFVRLVNPGRGTEDTRRLAGRGELGPQWGLVARLAGERLVVTNRGETDQQETVEVVHEALIRHWPQLRGWLEADRAFLSWRSGLQVDLERWEAAEQGAEGLLQGGLLAVAADYLQTRRADLSPAEAAFIQAGLVAQQRAERRRRWVLFGSVAAALVMTVLAIVSVGLFQNAQAAEVKAIEQGNKAATAEANAVIDRDTAATAEANAVIDRDTAATAEANAVIDRDMAATAGAAAVTAEAEAVTAAEALARQNERAQAELDFYQTTDPTERLVVLQQLFSRPEAAAQARARALFFSLLQFERLSLLAVTDQPTALATVGGAILPNLADINGLYYTTNDYLTTLQDSVSDPDLQTLLTDWLAARQAAQAGDTETALTGYSDLLATHQQNPALWYEQARLQSERGQTQAALHSLNRVMALAEAETYHSGGGLPAGLEFANSDHMTQAVQRLLLVNPALAAELAGAEADYPHLPAFEPPTVKIDQTGTAMVRIPAGPFNMGSNASADEQPVHTVYLAEYYIDQYEVTNTQFVAFLTAEGNQTEGEDEVSWYDPEDGRIEAAGDGWQIQDDYEKHPVTGVNWYGARAYCAWRGGRLPSEAEWEKAARGDDERTYPWGEGIDHHLARYYNSDRDDNGTVPVGSYPAGISPYGVHDLAGNVWEWVADAYDETYYQNSPPKNPPGPEDDQNIRSKVLRGGSWSNYTVNYLRAALRLHNYPDNRGLIIGWRCVVSAPGLGFWDSGS